jgi:hypothetical protein
VRREESLSETGMIHSYRNRNPLRRTFMNVHRAALLILSAATTIVLSIVAIQTIVTGQQSRLEIISDDFIKPRPTPTPRPPLFDLSGSLLGGTKVARPKPTPTPLPPGDSKRYRLASSSATEPLSNAARIEQLGLTLWRLRLASPQDRGERILVRVKDKPAEWIPERIEADTPLREGDLVRISIESPRSGFLYIIDRDLFADGSAGDAMLIFPTEGTRGGDNQVGPGKLIDIPAQEATPNYFTARPASSDQVGKVFTIIVTSSRLDLQIGAQPLKVSPNDLAQWEKMWSAPVERFEMLGGAGQRWTEAEKLAAASKGGRQLTQDAPAPQTIYRVSSLENNNAFLIKVQLRYIK